MIDMRGFFTHRAYPCVVDEFKDLFDESKLNCNDYWFAFTDLQRKISNNKCPICEVELSKYPNKTHTATLDHFRPKSENKYPKLKCEPKNYILMCSLCNNTYKDDEFPLLDETKKVTIAQNIDDIVDEEPLLLNPTEKDPLDFFELLFRQTAQGGILELKPKNINCDSYEYKISETMIKMFSLSYCDEDTCQYKRKERNSNTDKMEAINVTQKSNIILRGHYGVFMELAKEAKKAIETKNKKPLLLFLKDKNRKKELEKYGFYRFIMKNQFAITN